MSPTATIKHEEITRFIEYVIELGGVFTIDDEYYVCLKETGERFTIEDKRKDKAPIRIYHKDRVPGNYFVLNPFKENSSENVASEWFFDVICSQTRSYLRRLVVNFIELYLDDASGIHQKFNDASSLTVDPDKTMLTEIDKLQPEHILTFSFHKQKKIGQIQSDLGEEEVMKSYGKSIRKKTWTFLNEIFGLFMKASPNKVHEMYEYTSQTLAAPTGEAFMKLQATCLSTMEPYIKLILNEDINSDFYKDNLMCLEKYQKMTLWDDCRKVTNQKDFPSCMPQPQVDSHFSVPGSMPQMKSKGVPIVHMTPTGEMVSYAPTQNPTMMFPNMQSSVPGVFGSAPIPMPLPFTMGTDFNMFGSGFINTNWGCGFTPSPVF